MYVWDSIGINGYSEKFTLKVVTPDTARVTSTSRVFSFSIQYSGLGKASFDDLDLSPVQCNL